MLLRISIRIRGSEYELRLNRKETSSMSSMYSNTSFNSMRKVYKSSSDSNTSSPMLRRNAEVKQLSDVPFVYVYFSPRCKQVCCSLWRIFLIIYAIVLPILFIIVVKETLSTLNKFDTLQEEMNHHMKLSNHHIEYKETRSRRDKQNFNTTHHDDGRADSIENAMKDFHSSYKILPKIEKQLQRELDVLREKTKNLDLRLSKISQSKLKSLYKELKNNNCRCQDNGKNKNGLSRSIPSRSILNSTIKGHNSNSSNEPFVVYTRWGATKCNSGLIYTGYTGVSPSSDLGGGSNYLCLTSQPTYKKFTKNRGSNTARIDASKYGKSFDHSNKNNFNKKVVQCSLCYENEKTLSLMIPGTNICPQSWTVSYTGYLASENSKSRTEYICVDNSATPLSRRSNSRIKASVIETTTVSNCNILPCNKESYVREKTLQCVLCVK